MKHSSLMNKVLLTFDWDWAPDVLTEPIIDELIERQIPSIWFVTHQTPLLDKLREHNDLFELGIHPNFFSGSTHGKSENEIIENLLKLVPEARCIRTHGLYQSSNLILNFGSIYGLQYDFSLFLPGCTVETHKFNFEDKGIIRVPYNWEDDIAMFAPDGIMKSYEDLGELANVVFDFHPIHVALNSYDLGIYNFLKSKESNISQWTHDMCEDIIDHKKIGTASIFRKILREKSGVIQKLDTYL